jgi:hypothetical protein
MSPILGARGGLAASAYGFTSAVAALPGNYESIATTTVGAGGAATVTFSSIAGTYSHLQLRYSCISNRGTYGIEDLKINLNSDTGSNYSFHGIRGDGAAVGVTAGVTQTYIYLDVASGTVTTNAFGVGIIDFLDYSNVYKYKTTRALTGVDLNGTVAGYGGRVGLQSGSWRNTAAVTSIVIAPLNGTQFNQYSSFALYGIK